MSAGWLKSVIGNFVRPYVYGHAVHHQARISFFALADVYLRGGPVAPSGPLRGVSPVLRVREGRAQRAEPRGYAAWRRQARSPVVLVHIPGALRSGLTRRPCPRRGWERVVSGGMSWRKRKKDSIRRVCSSLPHISYFV